VDALIDKVNIFGLYFASLDIRQDSSIHKQVFETIAEKAGCPPKNYLQLTDEEKIHVLAALSQTIDPAQLDAGVQRDTIESIRPSRRSSNITGGKDAAVILSANAIVH